MLSDETEHEPGDIAPSGTPERPAGSAVVRAGFIPLLDCAPLVAAAKLGFATAEGLTIDLVRQTSWATLRDRLAVGRFDAAQMLAPMAIAANLKVGGLAVPVVAPMALARGGNAITVSARLWGAMQAVGAVAGAGPAALGAALKAVIAGRSQPITLAMVHPFSSHNSILRYWLAACGIDPEADVRLVVVPPPYMGEALASGQIDGFCVGEPWNTQAVEAGAGVLILAAAEVWSAAPCKVLGVRADFAAAAPGRTAALIRAVDRAGRWADDPVNRGALAALLAEPDVLDLDAGLIERALAGRHVPTTDGGAPFIGFHGPAATLPDPGHALWFYRQMVRWSQVDGSPAAEAAALATYRPELYAAAVGPVARIPDADPGRLFDDPSAAPALAGGAG